MSYLELRGALTVLTNANCHIGGRFVTEPRTFDLLWHAITEVESEIKKLESERVAEREPDDEMARRGAVNYENENEL